MLLTKEIQYRDYNFSNSHIHSNNSTIAEKHLLESLYKSPFKEYIIVGDLNHNSADNIVDVARAGVDTFVMGSSFFSQTDYNAFYQTCMERLASVKQI